MFVIEWTRILLFLLLYIFCGYAAIALAKRDRQISRAIASDRQISFGSAIARDRDHERQIEYPVLDVRRPIIKEKIRCACWKWDMHEHIA